MSDYKGVFFFRNDQFGIFIGGLYIEFAVTDHFFQVGCAILGVSEAPQLDHDVVSI